MSKVDELIEKYVGNGITEKVARELITGDLTPTKKYSKAMIDHYIFRKKSTNARGIKDIIKMVEKQRKSKK